MIRAALWLTAVVLLMLAAWLRWPEASVLRTDFYDLLPNSGDSLWQQRAARQAADAYEEQVVLLVVGDDTLAAQAFIDNAVAELGVASSLGTQWQTLIQTLKHQRFNLLHESQVRQLKQQPEALLQRFQGLLYSPLGSSAVSQLLTDPAGLWRDYVMGLTPLQDVQQQQGDVTASVRVTLSDAALLTTWRDLKHEASAQGLQLYATGAPLFAAAAKHSASREMRTVGLASLLALTIVLWRFLRSWTALALVLLCVGTGLLAGFLTTVMVLGSVHVLTLVFGVTIIGVAADYAFHYLAHARRSGDVLQEVLPGLRLSVLSSTLAFLLLLVLPFPGMRQMGLFMASGLLASFATVVLLYPALYRPPENPPVLPSVFSKTPLRLPAAAVVGALVFFVVGLVLFGSKGNDDVRDYYRVANDVEVDQVAIAARLGNTGDSRFLLFYGESEQAVAEREEPLIAAGVPVASSLVPSEKRQRENYELIKQFYGSAVFTRHLRALGFDDAGIAAVREQLPSKFSVIDAARGEAPGLGQRLGCLHTVCASWAPLGKAMTEEQLTEMLAHSEGVELINPIADFNQLLSTYRQKVLALLLVAALLVVVIGAVLYGLKTALAIICLPLLACSGSLFVMALGYNGLSLATVLAALVVAGVSLDYAIFKALSTHQHYPKTVLAISLSSMTSIIAFGALMFSSTPFLRQFGVGIAVGLCIAYGLVWFRVGAMTQTTPTDSALPRKNK